jgi:hypothetical protein
MQLELLAQGLLKASLMNVMNIGACDLMCGQRHLSQSATCSLQHYLSATQEQRRLIA